MTGKLIKKTERFHWIDQLKGFAIFLVVYGHNFPRGEKYIYSFHMPLFIVLAGLFHPSEVNYKTVKKRVQRVLVPYFLWSLLLYVFWFFLGRKYGESAKLNLSIFKNFIGVFYAQGGREYMDWGIPMWFLPAIFMTFCMFSFVEKIKGYSKFLVLLMLIVCGFVWGEIFKSNLFWSLDIAMVSMFFYGFGFYLKNKIFKWDWKLCLFFGIIHFVTYQYNGKVDMYRSEYGNVILFLLNGISGFLFYLGLFKKLLKIKILDYLGKNTIVVLATQLRAITFIKLLIIVFTGVHFFEFSEIQKIVVSFLQIVIILPIIFIINKYIPILNGRKKKN